MVRKVEIVKEAINLGLVQEVGTVGSGAINTFIGTVRNETSGKKVLKLEFEAYTAMALKEMNKLVDEAASRWSINGILFIHRVGVVLPGETAVYIAVSTPHRADSFDACRYLIDTLKQTVPIWKKEFFEDGEIWVAAHP